jgi:hypothetical protein
MYDATLIVLTGDHGEELHDHGGFGHGTPSIVSRRRSRSSCGFGRSQVG